MRGLQTAVVFFRNMYAPGTRTARGMEALTLCIPPTPGNSILRRPNNRDFSFFIATVLKQKKLQPQFYLWWRWIF